MPERVYDDPLLPPPGRRSGAGSASIMPYLLKTLATRPQASGAEALPQPAGTPPSMMALRPDRQANQRT